MDKVESDSVAKQPCNRGGGDGGIRVRRTGVDDGCMALEGDGLHIGKKQ